MGSAFDADFAASAVPQLLDVFGDSAKIKYLNPQADPVSLTAILGDIRARPEDGERGRKRRKVRQVKFSTDPASADGGVAEPAEQHTLEIDGSIWSIESIDSINDSMATVTVVRIGSVEISRQGYRER